MADVDIYADLPNFNLGFDSHCPEKVEHLMDECTELKKQITELSLKFQELQKTNENLEINLTSLLKTAKAEISRKDKIIDELRKKLDDISFRRNNYNRTQTNINTIVRQPLVPKSHESTMFVDTIKSSIPNGEISFKQDIDRKENAKIGMKQEKSTTVFTERLRKRIREEEEIEKKQKMSVEVEKEIDSKIKFKDKTNQSHLKVQNSKNSDDYYNHQDKNKHSWSRSRSPDSKYINRRHNKYQMEKYRKSRERFVKQRDFDQERNQEESALNNSNKKSHDLRSKIKHKCSEKYSVTEVIPSKRFKSEKSSHYVDVTPKKSKDNNYERKHKRSSSRSEKHRPIDKRRSNIENEIKTVSHGEKNPVTIHAIKTNEEELLEDGEIVDTPCVSPDKKTVVSSQNGLTVSVSAEISTNLSKKLTEISASSNTHTCLNVENSDHSYSTVNMIKSNVF